MNLFKRPKIGNILTDMALMRMATAWERFVLKDLPTVGRYAKVELTPPGPGELVGVVKGVGGLVQDTLTFRWAQVTVKEATVNAIVLAEIAGKGSIIGYQV